jgi:hypothetical protein
MLSRTINFLCSVVDYLPTPVSSACGWILVPLADRFCVGKDREEPLF